MAEGCIFCRIAKKEIETQVVYEDEHIIAFKDMKPRAPVHILFIPKKHITTMNDIGEEDVSLLGRMFLKIKETAGTHGISESGYRVVINCNKNAGQEVFHLHAHLLGGRLFSWPPG
ncbi:MAG: histidine triad nucleotide-binding protein [Candidatus Omnitrophica bacterium]|nr:histidine triad nucleotide-binding protein [Candidatus Omnitrophota bacterium]